MIVFRTSYEKTNLEMAVWNQNTFYLCAHLHLPYLQGYKTRQALYACRTCQEKATSTENGDASTAEKAKETKKAGVCLGCSMECHDGHDLVELYTKRLFRCDCGNAAFPEGFKCKLNPVSVVED